MNILRIYDSTRTKLHQATISQVSRMTWLHYFVGMDVLQIDFPIGDKAAAYLQKNGWIVDENDRPFIIKYVYQGQADHVARAYAYSPHFGFNFRVTRPSQGDSVLSATGSADHVVKAFISDALAGDRSLGITCLADQAGSSITDQTRRKPLGNEVVRILSAASLGEDFKWNSGSITFDTFPGKDRTKGNLADNAECVFAGRLNNVENEAFELDASAEQTTPYVAGAGEDEAREIYAAGTDKTGWDRNEILIDARDVAPGDTDTLAQRAAQAILGATFTVKATARDNVNLVYGRDYDVGDLVTVHIPYKTYDTDGAFFKPVQSYLSLNLRISKVTITYEFDQMKVDVTFGSTVEQQQAGNINSRVSSLEASVGNGLTIDQAYPVGTIYKTSSWDNRPAIKFGGTWMQIKDKFILGAGDVYANGATGGSKDLQQHYHDGLYFPGAGYGVTLDAGASTGFGITGYGSTMRSDGKKIYTASAGVGAGGNMPPYVAKYIWERTA